MKEFKTPLYIIAKEIPDTYKWIVRKIIKFTICRRRFYHFNDISKYLNQAEEENKETDKEFTDYQQNHKPLRNYI